MKKCNQEFADLLSNKRNLSEDGEDLQDVMVNIATKRRKKLVKIDHDSVQYVPLRKNLYDEFPEIANLTKEVYTYRRTKSKTTRFAP